jgi:hypothetical protein
MTDGNTYAINKHLNDHEDWDTLREVTRELELAEARIEELEGKLSKSEALLAKAVEDLEWQANAINNSVTVNMKHNHRILLDGVYHEGPLVDWVHKILTGFEALNRTTLAKLKEETE